jgi:hypothetical protein
MKLRSSVFAVLLAAAALLVAAKAVAAAAVDGINLHWTSAGSGPQTLVHPRLDVRRHVVVGAGAVAIEKVPRADAGSARPRQEWGAEERRLFDGPLRSGSGSRSRRGQERPQERFPGLNKCADPAA